MMQQQNDTSLYLQLVIIRNIEQVSHSTRVLHKSLGFAFSQVFIFLQSVQCTTIHYSLFERTILVMTISISTFLPERYGEITFRVAS